MSGNNVSRLRSRVSFEFPRVLQSAPVQRSGEFISKSAIITLRHPTREHIARVRRSSRRGKKIRRELNARVKLTKLRSFLFPLCANYRVARACPCLISLLHSQRRTRPPFFRSYIRGGVSFFLHLPASGTHMYSLSH